MKENPIKDKSLNFAIQVIEFCKILQSDKKEFVLSKQLLRSGTAIGALYREAEHAESKKDFIHKLAIAQKECNETMYWCELLEKTNYMDSDTFALLNNNAVELIRLLTSIIKTAKASINN